MKVDNRLQAHTEENETRSMFEMSKEYTQDYTVTLDCSILKDAIRGYLSPTYYVRVWDSDSGLLNDEPGITWNSGGFVDAIGAMKVYEKLIADLRAREKHPEELLDE